MYLPIVLNIQAVNITIGTYYYLLITVIKINSIACVIYRHDSHNIQHADRKSLSLLIRMAPYWHSSYAKSNLINDSGMNPYY